MLRSEIKSSINEVNDALEESGIVKIFDEIRERGGVEDPDLLPKIIEASQEYKKRADNFSSAAEKIVEILELRILEDPDFWVQVLHDERSPIIPEALSRLSFATKSLPKFKSIVDQESQIKIDKYAREKRDKIDILLFEEGRPSRPSRLTKAINGIEGLYEACAELEGGESSELTVAALDSGSDMSISFLGSVEPLRRLKELILSLWDWAVLYREKKVEGRISAIQGSLEVYNEISELEKNDEIEEERAEKLRKLIDSNVSKLVESGAVASEVKNQTGYSPRSIMSPNQKLLRGKREDSEDQGESAVNQAGSAGGADATQEEGMPFDENEVDKLKSLLDQAEEDEGDDAQSDEVEGEEGESSNESA